MSTDWSRADAPPPGPVVSAGSRSSSAHRGRARRNPEKSVLLSGLSLRGGGRARRPTSRGDRAEAINAVLRGELAGVHIDRNDHGSIYVEVVARTGEWAITDGWDSAAKWVALSCDEEWSNRYRRLCSMT